MSKSPWQVKAMSTAFYLSIFATLYYFLWDSGFKLSYVYLGTLGVVIISIVSRAFSAEVDQEAKAMWDAAQKKKQEK